MGFSWASTAATTGLILADLDLSVDRVKQSIGRYESATAGLPLPTAPENWERATLAGATNMILLQDNPDDPAHGIPVWGGMVTQSVPDHTDVLPMTLSTIEAYFDRRFVGNHVFTQVGQNVIVQTLVESYAAAGSNGGIPIRVQIVHGGAGMLRDREYKDQDDKTLYSVLSDLSGVIGGPEWTIGWEWQHNPERITPVLYVGDRIGNAVAPGFAPVATFELPGLVSVMSHPRDYSNGRGANDVMATSSSSGTVTTRPQSPRQVFADPDRPTFEHRYSPSMSITEVATLTDYASKALAALRDGTTSVSLSAVVAKGTPQLGIDWDIGDDLGFVIHAPAFPNGKTGIARALGWEIGLTEPQTVTPILLGEDI